MTPEDKRNRRRLKHQLQKSVVKPFMRRMGLRWTTAQIHAAVKEYVDRQAQIMRKSPLTVHGEISPEGNQASR